MNSIPLDPKRIAWPISILDFEASALGKLSYPVEIGLCTWDAPDHAARYWSTLISPAVEWIAHGLRSSSADKIHGIAREDIINAPHPADVLAAINQRMDVGGIAHCDGGPYDLYWMTRLQDAAGFTTSFHLCSLGVVLNAMDERQRQAFNAARPAIAQHRAADDACAIMTCIAAALDLKRPTLVPMD